MIQHPHQLHAQAALWSLRAALRYLAEHREAVLIRRPQLGPAQVRPRSLASLQQHDVVLRQERAERAAGSLNGLKPSAGSSGPISPGLIDLERETNQALVEAHGLLAYAHHRHPVLAWSGHWHDVLDDLFAVTRDARWTWMVTVLPVTRPGIAEAVGITLADADARVRAVCGIEPDRIALPLAPECPACGVRRLRVQNSAPNSARWTVVCASAGCRCTGTDCACGMDVRVRGVGHIWSADSEVAVSLLAGLRANGLRLAA
jgi:hypothetical protein